MAVGETVAGASTASVELPPALRARRRRLTEALRYCLGDHQERGAVAVRVLRHKSPLLRQLGNSEM